MFDVVLLRAQDTREAAGEIDLGFLAETLLFYGQVHISGDHNTLRQLIRQVTPDLLVHLLEDEYLKLHYETNSIVLVNVGASYSTGLVASQRYDPTRVAETTILSLEGRRGRARRVAGRIVRNLQAEEHTESRARRVDEDLLDAEYFHYAAATTFKRLGRSGGDLSPRLRTEVSRDSQGMHFTVMAESPIGANVPTVSGAVHLPASEVVMSVISARQNLELAAQYGAELATSPRLAGLTTFKISEALRQRVESEQRLLAFQELVAPGGLAIREAVNGGQCTFVDVVRVLPRARKFRHWLQEQPPSADLVREYCRNVVEGDPLEHMPARVARWAMFTGAGLAVDVLAGGGGLSTAAGVGLSVADAFLVDLCLKGWRPHHFVEEEMRKLWSDSGEQSNA